MEKQDEMSLSGLFSAGVLREGVDAAAVSL